MGTALATAYSHRGCHRQTRVGEVAAIADGPVSIARESGPLWFIIVNGADDRPNGRALIASRGRRRGQDGDGHTIGGPAPHSHGCLKAHRQLLSLSRAIPPIFSLLFARASCKITRTA